VRINVLKIFPDRGTLVSHQGGKWNIEREQTSRESGFVFGRKVAFAQRRFPPENNNGSLEKSILSHFSTVTIN
jgi:hypothetical protein